MDRKELREWINTSVAIVGIFILCLGTYLGVNELQDVNVNLNSIRFREVTTEKLVLTDENGTPRVCHYLLNDSHWIMGGCPE